MADILFVVGYEKVRTLVRPVQGLRCDNMRVFLGMLGAVVLSASSTGRCV